MLCHEASRKGEETCTSQAAKDDYEVGELVAKLFVVAPIRDVKFVTVPMQKTCSTYIASNTKVVKMDLAVALAGSHQEMNARTSPELVAGAVASSSG